MRNPFRCFNSSPEVIRLAVMMYIRYTTASRKWRRLAERGKAQEEVTTLMSAFG